MKKAKYEVHRFTAVFVTTLVATLLFALSPSHEEVRAVTAARGSADATAAVAVVNRQQPGTSDPCGRTAAASGALRYYGLEECQYLGLPAETRYPRVPDPDAPPPPEALIGCIGELVRLQEEGELTFVLHNGNAIGARTLGLFHGSSDDVDVDLILLVHRDRRSFSKVVEQKITMSCGAKLLRGAAKRLLVYQAAELPLPSSSTSAAPATNDDDDCLARQRRYPPGVAAFGRAFRLSTAQRPAYGPENANRLRGQVFPISRRTPLVDALRQRDRLPCICQYLGFEVLCPSTEAYMNDIAGGSWWLPPPSGGKGFGRSFPDYFDPSVGKIGKWYTGWLTKTIQGLRSVDTNDDFNVDFDEFVRYATTHPRVNQRWLTKTLEVQPCVVRNAQVHYNHTLFFGRLGMRGLVECGARRGPWKRGGREIDAACVARQWESLLHRSGFGLPPYGECLSYVVEYDYLLAEENQVRPGAFGVAPDGRANVELTECCVTDQSTNRQRECC